MGGLPDDQAADVRQDHLSPLPDQPWPVRHRPDLPEAPGPSSADVWIERLARIGSWDLDVDDRFRFCSPGARALFRSPCGVPLSLRGVVDGLEPEDGAALLRAIAAARRQGRGFDLVVRVARPGAGPSRLRLIAETGTVVPGAAHPLRGVVHDVTVERMLEDRLRHLADHDPLTGLFNRRALTDALASGSATIPAGKAVVMLLDLDHFKSINDHHGHAGGDEALVEVSRRLRAALPDAVVLARLGGDEFAAVLAGTDGLAGRIRGIRAALEPPIRLRSARIPVTASLGAAIHLGGTPFDADTLLLDADTALYEAKKRGRNRACIFRPTLRAALEARRDVLDEVRQALLCGEIEPFFQPIVDLRTHAVRGVEALLRWHHPTRGILAPCSFQPALCDPDLSARLGTLMLNRSLRQLRDWDDAGIVLPCVNVNVSQSQLERGDELYGQVSDALRRLDLSPDRLKLEIVESAFLGHHPDAILRTISRFQRLGVLVALDDFGTGHASLTHLQKFAIGRIKIDRSFVADLAQPGSRAITRAIVELGATLGLRVVAEGVETREQLAFLLATNCDCGQGYLFSHPLPASRVPDFLRRWHRDRSALFAAAKLLPPPPG
ncbi:MAG: EAL domain-containing protein [Gluconacetobacter diazotrophicus]|nr:EAL domain-containing protein [Gluconacetobacter diazotrophicus]